MCAIFGTSDIERFREFYKANEDRGFKNRSITKIYPINGGLDNISIEYESDFDAPIQEDSKCIYYLGHIQSSTGYHEAKHPFRLKTRYLAHNGIISNTKILREKYNIDDEYKVDSSMILPLIKQLGFSKAFSELEGTFACWYFNSDNRALRFLRAGSTLYYDRDSFSSRSFLGSALLPEGDIMTYNFDKQWISKSDEFQIKERAFFI